jgi:hypothetical protein
MIMKFTYFVCLWSCFLLLTACPYESEKPITTAYCAIDSVLLGQWFIADFPKSKDSTDFTIYAFNDNEYFIESKQRNDAAEPVAHYRGYISKIAGMNILNINNFRGNNNYLFLRYALHQGQIKLDFLDDAHFGDAPLDTVSIQSVIRKHRTAEDLFELESTFLLQPSGAQ